MLAAKLSYYLLLSSIGVFFAEVLSWSAPDVLYNPIKFIIVTPVYAVHLILFGNILARWGRRDWQSYYAFGMLTGMYETFITKVFWSPPWNPEGVGFLGFAWLEVFWIGFAWHAVMSFMLPLKIAEHFFFPRRDARTDKRWLIILAGALLVGVIFGVAFAQSPATILTGFGASSVTIGVAALLFTRIARRANLMAREDIVLGPRGFRLSVVFFLTIYITYFLVMRPEAIPGPTTIVATLILDLLIVLLILNILRFLPGETDLPRVRAGAIPFTFRSYAIASVLAFFVAAVGVVLGYVMQSSFVLVAMLIIVAGVITPLVLLGVIARQIFQSWRAERRSGGPPTAA